MPKTYNVKSLFYGPDLQLVSPAHVRVGDDGRIEEIGKGFELTGKVMKNEVALPALINAHTHVGDSAFKDAGLDLTLGELVEPVKGLKYQLLASAKEGDLVRAMRGSATYMLRGGTVMFADFREGGIRGLSLLHRAMRGLPIRSLAFGRPVDVGRAKREELEEVLEKAHGIGISSPTNFDAESLRLIREVASSKGRPVVTHVREDAALVGDFELAEKYLKPDIMVHMIHATSEQLRVAKEMGASVVCCPRSNAFLTFFLPPIDEMLDLGLNVALGTDNVAWVEPNLFKEMEFTFTLLRLKRCKPIDASLEVVKMCTINAARALRMEKDYGSIEEGKRASLIFVSLEASNLSPSLNALATIARRGMPGNIRLLLLDGKEVPLIS